jgi:hypothetical protein
MIKKILLLALVLVAVQSYRLIRDGGVLTDVPAVSYGQCEALFGPIGAEDMTIDRERGLAFIGADPRRSYLLTGDQSGGHNGAIWTLDLNRPDAIPILLPHDLVGAFHPHGISLHINAVGERRLYVINHQATTRHSIDVFLVQSDRTLRLERQFGFPELISPNDLLVLQDGTFFVTNDHGSPRHTLLEKVEDYLGIPWSNVVFFDGERAHVVVDGLRMANGIAMTPDERELYVAETTARRVSRFVRGNSPLSWTKVESLDIGSGPDNLEWDQQGRLLTGAHPRLFDFLAHMKDEQEHSPSEVIRMQFGTHGLVERLYANDGAEISGSSVAVEQGDTLLIGSVFEPQMLRCVKR